MKPSQFAGPWGGKKRFKFAQQVINAVLTQCCHAAKKETLEEFCSCCRVRKGHGSESIDHYGASDRDREFRSCSESLGETREEKPRLAGWVGGREEGE